MSKNLWRAQTGIFLGAWLYLLVLGKAQFLNDPGVFWSTVIGQHTLSEGRIPRAEEFSCTLPGQPWNSHQWLAQCGMAFLHDTFGGLETLVLATAVLLAALYTWVAQRLIRGGWHWSVAVVLVGLTIQASRYHLLARPYIATIVLMGWVFAQLIDFESGRTSLARLFWIPPMIALWSNLHGGVLGGLGTLSLVIAGWCLAWPLGISTPVAQGKQLFSLLLLLAACWLATLVNPYGWELPRDWLAIMQSPVIHRYIVEHQPLDWANPYQLPIIIFGLVYLLALANLRSWRQLQVTWLLPLVWLALSIQRVRHCTLFSITTALALVEVLRHTRAADWLTQHDSWIYKAPGPTEEVPHRGAMGNSAWMLLPAAVVVLALLLQKVQVAVPGLPMFGHGWVQLDREFWPVDLLPKLRDHEKEHPGAPIFNDLAYGGFLIYYTPKLRVFIDDRCELYGDAFLEDYFESNKVLFDAKATRWSSEIALLIGNASPNIGPLALANFTAVAEAHHRRTVAKLDFVDRWANKYGVSLDVALVRKRSGFHYYFDNLPEQWTKVGATAGSSDFKPGSALYVRKAKGWGR